MSAAARTRQARQWSARLRWLAAGVCGWAMFYPRPYSAAIAACLTLPFVGLWALWRLNREPDFDGIEFNSLNNAFSGVDVAIITPSLALCLRAALDWQVLEWPAFWLPFALITLGFFGCAWLAGAVRRRRIFSALALALFAAAYGAGATLNLNVMLARGPATSHHARIVGKYVSHGKVTIYNLRLSAWGHQPEADTPVPHAIWSQYETGDTVEILVRTGGFGIPFWRVR